MPADDPTLDKGAIIFNLREICIRCHLPAEQVLEMIDYGIVEPVGQHTTELRFTSVDLLRLNKARRIRRDLNVNLSGVALSLELIDKIEELNIKLRRLGVGK